MTPRPPSPRERQADLLVTAASSAHAAGVCGSLVRDRVEACCLADGLADLIPTLQPGQLAELDLAARRFETAAIGLVEALEPDARLRVATVADTARDMARGSLIESLQASPCTSRAARGSAGR